jgi:tripartite-type tricarboxylate transporter receptor subunit TctC
MVTASAGTPAPVLDKLNEILNAVLAEPEFRKQMLERNILPRPGTRQEAAAFVRQQTAKWAPITKSLNISFD